jgi:hypothetical protein
MVCALLFFGRYIPTYLGENLCPEEGNSRLLGKGSYLTNYTASQTKRLILIVNNFIVDNFLSSPPFFDQFQIDANVYCIIRAGPSL